MSEANVYVLDLESSGEAYPCRPATADEIKAAHPKCNTCQHWEGRKGDVEAFCEYMNMRMLDAHYCHRHTPKEQDHE